MKTKYRVWDLVEKRFLSWDEIQESTIQDIFNRGSLVTQQWTGSTDRYGKEIYEGDICRFDAVEIDGFDCLICDLEGEVRWDSEDTGFYYLTSSDRFPHVKPWFTINMAVIGNIYENPELLTESGI